MWTGQLNPRLAGRLNLAADVAAVWTAVLVGGWLAGEAASPWRAVLASAAWLGGAAALRYYDPRSVRSALEDGALSLVLTALALLSLELAERAAPSAAGLSSLALPVLWPAAALARHLACRLGFGAPEQVLIVGCGPLGRATAEDLQRGRGRRRRSVVGFLSLPGDPEEGHAQPDHLGPWTALEQVLARTPVHEVYLAAAGPRDQPAVQEAVRTCETLGVPFAVALHGLLLRRATPRGAPDGYVHFTLPGASPLPAAVKRLFDVAASAGALLALSPVLLAIAAAVKLTSRGPVFFRQRRVGLHGRPFFMLKFRSMVAGAEALQAALRGRNEPTGPVFKIRDDPRVTPVGRFLRKHSLDELPQFINVLWGEMSVVGPRPPLPSEVAQYEPWQRRRLSVRPGLTCLWQVGGRNHIGFRQWMYLDLRYIDHWSLRRDLSLVLRTIPVVLHGQGAS